MRHVAFRWELLSSGVALRRVLLGGGCFPAGCFAMHVASGVGMLSGSMDLRWGMLSGGLLFEARCFQVLMLFTAMRLPKALTDSKK